MTLSTETAKTKITAKLCKTLGVFRAWFDITPEPKKCFIQKARKALFSDWNCKILVWFRCIFYANIHVPESMSLH